MNDDTKQTPDEVDRLLEFILSDDSPVTDADRPAIETFNRAVEAAKARLRARADLRGPYGWLIMPEGLSEDAWYLADGPEPGVPSEPLFMVITEEDRPRHAKAEA